MAGKSVHSSEAVWALARQQHGVVTRRQLLERGYNRHAIEHRLRRGRLHPVRRGIYAVGRRELTQHGLWMAAALSCGAGSAISHRHGAAVWGIRRMPGHAIEVSVPFDRHPRARGLRVHRRERLEVKCHEGVPVTSVVLTLVDLATCVSRDELEAAISEADKLDLVDPERLRSALGEFRGVPGESTLRAALDRRTFSLTDSRLERLFLPIARKAGLPLPQTQVAVNGFRVDFHWPGLGLVVETDGLRYHRTPAQQAADRRRDQAHVAAGLTTLRFTHSQIRFEPSLVEATLAAVARRLAA
jgi:very-short-patch-repair endonuclease